MFLSYARNDTHYQLPLCIGLHVSSPPLYMQGFVLYTYMCTSCDMRHQCLYFHRLAAARPSYVRAQPLINVVIISVGYNCL